MINSYNARVHSITLLILLLLVSASSRAALIDEALRLNDTIRFELMSLSQQSELNRDICSINATASGLHAKQDSVLQQVVFSVIHFMVNSTHASQTQVCHRSLKRWIQSKNTSIARHLFRQINTEEQLIALLTNNLSVLEIEDDPDLTNAERINRARQWRDGLILVLQNKSFFDLISEATVYLSDCHCFIKTAVDNLNRQKHQDTEAVHTIFRKYAQYVEKVSRVKEADGIQRIVNPDGSIAYKTTNITFKPGHPLYTYAQDAFYQKTELCAVETMEAQVISTGHLLQRVASAVLRFIIPSTHALSPEECLLLTSGEVDLRERFLDEQIITAAQSRVLLASFQSIFSIVVDESFTAANRIELAQAWLDALIRSLRENPDHRAAIIESAQAIWGFHTFINNQEIAITDRVRYNRDIIVGGNGLNARIHNRQILPDDDNSHLNRDRVRAIVAINHYYYQFVNQDRHISEGDFLQIVNANSNDNLEDLFDLLHNRWNQLRHLQDSYNTQLTTENIVRIASQRHAHQAITILIKSWHALLVFGNQNDIYLTTENIVDIAFMDINVIDLLIRNKEALFTAQDHRGGHLTLDNIISLAIQEGAYQTISMIINHWDDLINLNDYDAEVIQVEQIITIAFSGGASAIRLLIDRWDDLINLFGRNERDVGIADIRTADIVSLVSSRGASEVVPMLINYWRALVALRDHRGVYLTVDNILAIALSYNRRGNEMIPLLVTNWNFLTEHEIERFRFTAAEIVAIASVDQTALVINALVNNPNVWRAYRPGGLGLTSQSIVAVVTRPHAIGLLSGVAAVLLLINEYESLLAFSDREGTQLTTEQIISIAQFGGAEAINTLIRYRDEIVNFSDNNNTYITTAQIVAILSQDRGFTRINMLCREDVYGNSQWDILTGSVAAREEQIMLTTAEIVAIASNEDASQVFTDILGLNR